MSDEALKNENARLRDQVAALEAARADTITVDIAGFEGLRDLSRAIENKQLDGFLYERGVSDKVYFGVVWAMVGVTIVLVTIAAADKYLGLGLI